MKDRLAIMLGVALVVGFAPRAGAADLGYPGSALAEFADKPRATFDDAPPLGAGRGPVAVAPDIVPAPAPAQTPAPAPTYDEYEAQCFVKIDGRVVIGRVCSILREKEKSVTFELTEGPLTLTFRQGRVWTARLGDREFGNVYKTGSCWGAHGFYACDRGRR